MLGKATRPWTGVPNVNLPFPPLILHFNHCSQEKPVKRCLEQQHFYYSALCSEYIISAYVLYLLRLLNYVSAVSLHLVCEKWE